MGWWSRKQDWESEVLTDLWFSLTSGSEVGGSLPGKFLGTAQLISETKEVQFGISFFFLSQMCLVKGPSFPFPRASCLWLHVTARLQTPPNTFPNILPSSLLLGEVPNISAQSCWLAGHSPGKSLGKHKRCTAFWWGEITSVPGRFQQNAPAVFDTGEAQAESVLHWLLTLLLADLGLIPCSCPLICLCYEAQPFNCLNAYLYNVHKSVMLKKIYPLIIQHSQPPSLGSCPSLSKRRKNYYENYHSFFFLFEMKHFCINA